MWAALIYGGALVLGLVVARWWLLAVPVAVYLIVSAASPVAPDDDVTGIGRFAIFIVSMFLLTLGIAAGRLARQRGNTPGRRDDEP